jgi:hypothetical protein
VALLLVWYKTVGAIFPPAAVLAGTLTTLGTDAASMDQLSETEALLKGATFLVTPWLTGHAALYGGALGMSQVRAAARLAMTENQMHELGGLSDDKLRDIFEKFDTDRSGALDADELKIALRVVLGADLAIEDVQKLVDRADRDGNSVVDFQEFCWVCRGEYS